MSVAILEFENFLDVIEGKIESQEERQAITRRIVEMAGYEIVSLENGKVYGREILDVDESRSFVANPLSELRVLGIDENSEPSCYLEMLWRRAAGLLKHPGREEALSYLNNEVTSHVGPFKPVVVSTLGEMISETFSQNYKHDGEETRLANSGRITHGICRSYVDLKLISPTHNALVCRGCHMRIPIPMEVETIGQLRAHFASYFAALENF